MQVRSFAKEGAVQARYEGAQDAALSYALRSAALDACFFPLAGSLATGKQTYELA